MRIHAVQHGVNAKVLFDGRGAAAAAFDGDVALKLTAWVGSTVRLALRGEGALNEQQAAGHREQDHSVVKRHHGLAGK